MTTITTASKRILPLCRHWVRPSVRLSALDHDATVQETINIYCVTVIRRVQAMLSDAFPTLISKSPGSTTRLPFLSTIDSSATGMTTFTCTHEHFSNSENRQHPFPHCQSSLVKTLRVSTSVSKRENAG
jgi:hypothetical protein